jgi:hypothetical protein
MGQTIYLVLGTTGEYSDHTEWNVAAYTEKTAAEEHARLLNEWVKGTDVFDFDARKDKAQKCPYDPMCEIDYTGTEYVVMEISLFRHVDEFMESEASRRDH